MPKRQIDWSRVTDATGLFAQLKLAGTGMTLLNNREEIIGAFEIYSSEVKHELLQIDYTRNKEKAILDLILTLIQIHYSLEQI